MKVFISWSGEQSRKVAEALRRWLPMMIQASELYVSSRDTQAGSRWSQVISANLDDTDVGILCLTPENLDSKWIHYEAGALGKSLANSRVVPLLHGVRPAEVMQPLAQFQMKTADESGILGVVDMINRLLVRPMDAEVLERLFGLLWPELESELASITAGVAEPPAEGRDERALLEEILALLRRGSWVGGATLYPNVNEFLSRVVPNTPDDELIRGADAVLKDKLRAEIKEFFRTLGWVPEVDIEEGTVFFYVDRERATELSNAQMERLGRLCRTYGYGMEFRPSGR